MKSIIEKSLLYLGSGEGASAEVVSIIASQGSSPRKKGAVMVVCNTGEVIGTIGGAR